MQPFLANEPPLSEKRHFADTDQFRGRGNNQSVGGLPAYLPNPATKFIYGKALEQQAQERQSYNKQLRQQELEQEKKMLQDNLNNDPFGRDRINYQRAHARSVLNAQRGFAGVGNQIINQKPILPNNNNNVQTPAQPQFEYPPPQQQFIPAYFDDLNQMRKKNQQEELRMAYQQQIAEREQRRVDDLRRKIQEEREEEERLRNKRGMEQRWMDEEYNRKLAQELLARQLLAEREAAERRKWGTGTRGTHRPPPTPPMDLPVEQPVPEPVVEEVVVDPVDEEAEREKRMREMKAELYGEMTKQVQGVLDHEMGKLKGQMDVQNKILRDQVLTLKSQALFAEELRQDAVVEFKRLHKEIEGAKVYEDIREHNLSKYLKDVAYLYKNTQPISDNGNFAFSFPERKMQPLFENKTRSTANYDRELAGEINFLPVREPTIGQTKNKYDRLKPKSSHQISNDYAMKRVDPNLPDYIDLNVRNPYYQQAKSDLIWNNDEFSVHRNMDVLDRNERRLEGLNELYKDDEIEKLDMMLRDSILGINHNNKTSFY